jgi:hypothetical protein
MTFKNNTLSAILLAGALTLPGCVPQEKPEYVLEHAVDQFVEHSDHYLKLNKLLRQGKYDKAEKVSEKYLRKQLVESSETLSELRGSDGLSPVVSKEIIKTIEKQQRKIQERLYK